MSRAGPETLPADRTRHLADRARIEFVQSHEALPHEDAVDALRTATVLAATNKCLPPLSADLFEACPRLRTIVLYATGYEHIDPELLRAYGVTLRTLPEYATQAVAEHALAMLFALAARVPLAHDRSRGIVDEDVSLRGVELAGRTLGIIGAGRIGRRLAGLARGIGMAVQASDLDPAARSEAVSAGIRVLGTDDLVGTSDVVAMCASTIRGSGPVLDVRRIAGLRPGALVVSIARPSRVDTAAMTAAIRAGQVRGYAIDDVVLGDADADLADSCRVLQTGHSAWWRDEVLARGAEMFADAIETALTGLPETASDAPAAAASAAGAATGAATAATVSHPTARARTRRTPVSVFKEEP